MAKKPVAKAQEQRKTKAPAVVVKALVRKTPPLPVAIGVWREGTPMKHARHGSYERAFRLDLLPDGGVLASGGVVQTKSGEREVEDVELRDPETGSWRVIPPAMATELLLGARPNPTLERKVRWTHWSDDQLNQYAYPRRGHVMVALGDAWLIAGGYQSEGNMGPFDGHDVDELSALLYSPTGTPRWRYAGHLAEPRCRAAAVRLVDGRVLVAGGCPAESSKTWRTTEIWEPF